MKEKGVGKGTDAGGPMLPKTCLKLPDEVLVVVGRAELEEGAVVTLDGLDGKGPSFSLLGMTPKMGSNRGDEDPAGAAEAEGLAGGVLSIPDRILGLGVGDGAGRAWDLADGSA